MTQPKIIVAFSQNIIFMSCISVYSYNFVLLIDMLHTIRLTDGHTD